MKQREIYYNDVTLQLKKGVDTLTNIVKCTLGPKGNNVVIEKHNGGFVITKDGVSVAKEVFLKDNVENLGAQLIKEAALKTNEIAGDGTTTSTILAHSLITLGLKNIAAGANPIDIKRGMDIALKLIIKELKSNAKKIESKEDLINVASISANNDYSIGKIIADALETAGEEGTVIVEDSKTSETFITVVDGMEFNRGYKSGGFINKKDRAEVELNNCYVLLYQDTLRDVNSLRQIMEYVYQKGNSSLLVIANEFSEDVLKLLLLNSVKGVINCCAVVSPGHGELRNDFLNDILAYTGGSHIFGGVLSLAQANLSHLGKANKVIVNKDKTIIFEGNSDSKRIQEIIESIKVRISEATTEYDRQKLQERLGRLTGGVVVLRVGASTETELKEKKMRVEDALHATTAALEEGIVPGGGVALLKVRDVLKKNLKNDVFVKGNIEDQRTGINIVYYSLEAPFLSICENAGLKGDALLKDILNKESFSFGYDILNDKYGDLFELGVIDPVKVTRLSLENAISVASMFLTTKGAIIISDVEKNYVDKLLSQS